MTIEEINKAIKDLPEQEEGNKAGAVSDGYHSFDELYEHRIELFIALANLHERLNSSVPRTVGLNNVYPWKSFLHSDLSQIKGWFIAGLTVNGVQITYHLPNRVWDDLKVQELAKAPKFDGHTSKDVLSRIRKLLY